MMWPPCANVGAAVAQARPAARSAAQRLTGVADQTPLAARQQRSRQHAGDSTCACVRPGMDIHPIHSGTWLFPAKYTSWAAASHRIFSACHATSAASSFAARPYICAFVSCRGSLRCKPRTRPPTEAELQLLSHNAAPHCTMTMFAFSPFPRSLPAPFRTAGGR